jgi:L,D-transpeptidase catalytic domain/Putative peptidoglycan binding domain
LSYRKYTMTRRGARAVTLVAFASAILIGVEAAARAQEAVGQPEAPVDDGLIADGVTVSGLDVGGMDAEEAWRAVNHYALRPVSVTFESDAWSYAPTTLGAHADVDGAVEEALRAAPAASLELAVTVNEKRLQRWTRSFARRFDVKPENAEIVLRGLRPVATRADTGRELSRWSTRTALLTALESNDRLPVALIARVVKPRVTGRELGLAIVIKRASNKLILYRPGGPKGMKVKRRFGVATGQPSYPTPLGNYEIVNMQRNPWWRPPDSDWAEGEEPIPPGPGNPLGTRWMGLSAPAVGIHGTPDAASIGYSASHGCIRMLVPEAEWLFERVEEGTPVYIVDA